MAGNVDCFRTVLAPENRATHLRLKEKRPHPGFSRFRPGMAGCPHFGAVTAPLFWRIRQGAAIESVPDTAIEFWKAHSALLRRRLDPAGESCASKLLAVCRRGNPPTCFSAHWRCRKDEPSPGAASGFKAATTSITLRQRRKKRLTARRLASGNHDAADASAKMSIFCKKLCNRENAIEKIRKSRYNS